jgi:inner membrane protein
VDNICHSLAGAALGYAGLSSRTRLGMTTIIVAANLPDVDVGVFFTNTLAVSFRRGWTHGVLAQLTLPVALAALMWLAGRRAAPAAPDRASPHLSAPGFVPLLLLSYIGVYSHVFLDFLNSYGVRLLMPFSDRWFYGDALYVIDPWMYLVLGFGVWLAHRRTRRGSADAATPARVALAVALVYTAAMLVSNLWARSAVRDGLARAGQPADTRFMVTPVVVNPFRREVLVDTGDRYEKGFVWFEPAPHFRPAGYGVDKGLDAPAVRPALAEPRARAYLRWSRFPFAVIDRTKAPPRVILNDYRYSDQSGLVGWAGLQVRVE